MSQTEYNLGQKNCSHNCTLEIFIFLQEHAPNESIPNIVTDIWFRWISHKIGLSRSDIDS